MKKMLMFAALLSFGILNTPFTWAETLSPKDTAAELNHLIERAVDGEKGFAESAEHSSVAGLKAKYLITSAQRKKFAEELQAKVQALGQDPEQSGSAAGAVHRAWIDVKTTVRSDDDKAVLGAIKTGEDAALQAYNNALEKQLPDDVRKIITDQRDKIQESCDWVNQELDKLNGKTA